ncbi:coiled-coil domain-containing protein 9-like isoform X2 [Haliotis rubra]|uniref:coiled-coil domain-containing protein 9-like isoform X2 n=1 Tax=Haliotis rubra TaxID=36100 RepID=UPI001EE5535A|nr:coiled-coil domain-containing protein 9-like isoform X2 [Haliotis rubra]
MADNMNKELFLDILTKEEKEALLTKKMEEIRKKNDALRKRHEEIEADKRVAAKNNPNKDVNSYTREASSSGSSSPQKESKSLPGEDRRGPRPKSGGRGKPQVGGKSKEKKPQGPPPDPSYNFLADRRREGPAKESNGETPVEKVRKPDTRRHPKNYGGQDFNNVKTQMRTTKERQERPKSGPPRTKMELAMAMTGKERKQYLEWKAERDRVDQERMDRQKSTSGEWRRAWDADKNQQDFEQSSSPQRTEPAKRPGVKQEQDVQTKPVGRGRARGRGRGRGRGDRSPRQRTFSSGDESRKVERQKDLLVVKIDNSGKETNQSVEVEYWDDDMMDVKSNSAASVKSGTSSRDGHSNHARRRRDDHQFDDHDEGQDGDDNCVGGHQRRHTHSHSLGDENEHDESWEDCPEDSEFYADDDYADGDDRYKEPLKLECKLNPDAPEFTPTSPEFMKTPPGHVKVMDWVTEVNSNLSPTSPSPTMDGVNNDECKRALSKDKSNSSGKSSSHGGVTKYDTKVTEEELSASYIDEKETHDSAAPEASEEFLDASGDVGEAEISQLSSEEVGNNPESKSSTVGSCGDVEDETDPSTQNTEVSTVHKDKVIDEAQSDSKVDRLSEPEGNNETIANSDGAVVEMKEVDSHIHSGAEISLIDQPLSSCETGISATAAPLNPATDAIRVEPSSVEPKADAMAVEPTASGTHSSGTHSRCHGSGTHSRCHGSGTHGRCHDSGTHSIGTPDSATHSSGFHNRHHRNESHIRCYVRGTRSRDCK